MVRFGSSQPCQTMINVGVVEPNIIIVRVGASIIWWRFRHCAGRARQPRVRVEESIAFWSSFRLVLLEHSGLELWMGPLGTCGPVTNLRPLGPRRTYVHPARDGASRAHWTNLRIGVSMTLWAEDKVGVINTRWAKVKVGAGKALWARGIK